MSYLKVLTALAAVSLITAFYVVNKPVASLEIDEPEEPTIYDWQHCIERTMLKTCDLDDQDDRSNCYSAASNTVKCYSESSTEASRSCIHWWIFFESAKSDDTLPDSFYQCSEDCLVYAKENNFYFQQYFSPVWITCAVAGFSPY